jgi:hypothetical protein
MHPSLKHFIRQYLGVVMTTLVPVVLTAFLTMPFILSGHPGEPRAADAMVARHMT